MVAFEFEACFGSLTSVFLLCCLNVKRAFCVWSCCLHLLLIRVWDLFVFCLFASSWPLSSSTQSSWRTHAIVIRVFFHFTDSDLTFSSHTENTSKTWKDSSMHLSSADSTLTPKKVDHIPPALRSLHCQRIDFWILLLVYKKALNFLICCYVMNHNQTSEVVQVHVCFQPPESKLNMEKQRSAVTRHVSGTKLPENCRFAPTLTPF